MTSLFKRIKTIWQLSEAEVHVNYANEVKLKTAEAPKPANKLAQIIDFHTDPLQDIPKDDGEPENI